jgi:hypothetical protein
MKVLHTDRNEEGKVRVAGMRWATGHFLVDFLEAYSTLTWMSGMRERLH